MKKMVCVWIIFLVSANQNFPEVQFKNISKKWNVLVQGKQVKANYRVVADEQVSMDIPEPVEVAIVPQNIPLQILYEDQDILIVDKPKGMVVHPAPGHPDQTLVNAVMYHCKDSLSGINGEIRPGIVHRIDQDTTGSLIICKNDTAHIKIAEQIKVHSIRRIYRGIVIGRVAKEEGVIHAPIGRNPTDRKKMAINEKNGKDAITHYRVLKRYKDYTYMEFQLETGRTHQIRVHMASIGHPLLGDMVYGPKNVLISCKDRHFMLPLLVLCIHPLVSIWKWKRRFRNIFLICLLFYRNKKDTCDIRYSYLKSHVSFCL